MEWYHLTIGPMTWQEAVDFYAARRGGWRLPTIEELVGLIDWGRYSPASKIVMPPDYFWSSTSRANDKDFAWVVDFSLGVVHVAHKANSKNYVRCVRVREA